ncbi:putative lipoprotein [Sphaerisporangium rufum]|uniref:Lipoprotein n=1 Tax=Sphaerisporangium rufum TaxID=1381558 RepID=A0A919R7U8_9ACTN|nr:LppX_LprAFG lipoprotein [Sphaerisporangium rufum]GII79810.1 putative lipoprotein [Sphaerisporangium rufum]
MTSAVVATGSAMLIAVSACGQAPQRSATALGAVQLTAAETLQQSARQAESVTSYTAKLALDFSSKQEGSGSIGGTMVYRQKPQLASDVTLDQINVGGQNVAGGARVILVGDTAYLKVDMLNRLVGAAKPWIKIDLTEAGQHAGVNVDQYLSQAQQVDLQTSVKMLTSSKDAQKVGTETVGGVETTHYKGTFTVAEAVKALAPDVQQKVQGRLDSVKDMKFDAWIDADNLPRKVEMNGGATEGTFKLTSLFSAFNESAEVTAPPADQVGDLPRNLGELGRDGAGGDGATGAAVPATPEPTR